jgi:hypothetical protein
MDVVKNLGVVDVGNLALWNVGRMKRGRYRNLP